MATNKTKKATEPASDQLAVVKSQVTKATGAATELVVNSHEGLEAASVLLTKIKQVAKIVTDRKDGFTRPAYKAYKEIMAQAKEVYDPLLEDCAEAERIVKQKAITYKNAVEAEAARKREELAKKVEEGKMKEDTAVRKMETLPVVQSNIENEKGGSLNFRKVRVVKIVDATLIPREYLVVDEVKVRKVALAGVEIPGVIVVEEDQVAGR